MKLITEILPPCTSKSISCVKVLSIIASSLFVAILRLWKTRFTQSIFSVGFGWEIIVFLLLAMCIALHMNLSGADSKLYMRFEKAWHRAAQGMGIWGDRAFILYDTGACAVYDLVTGRMTVFADSKPIRREEMAKGSARARAVYGELLTAAEALLAFVKTCKGRTNKDNAKLASQIRNLIEKWK